MAEAQRPDTGFDFTDDPVTASTGHFHRRTSLDRPSGPFDDRYQSQYGTQSWYQPDMTGFELGNVGQEGDGDSYTARMGDDHRRSEYERRASTSYGQTSQYRGQYEKDDLDELYGSAIAAEQARRELVNPFAPPVPPMPLSNTLIARPDTSLTNIYGSYESRPVTHADRAVTDDDADRDPPVQTPSTSSLLPWLDKRKATTPVPRTTRQAAERRMADVAEEEVDSGRTYTRYESNAAGVGAARGGQAVRPARPVMAQTPAGAGSGGFNVLIPGFR
jgi:hypothetical protein